MIFKSFSEDDTNQIAAEFAATLKPRDIVLLQGDLGLGKSVFSRAVVRSLMQSPTLDVPSPTFTLVQTYEAPEAEIWHFDLYRLKDPEELYEIGWEDALTAGILLIEWPDRLEYLRPQKYITVTLTQGETSTSRVITIERQTP